MAITMNDGTYACSVCGERYKVSSQADGCRDSHQLLYIPISKTELNRLLNAIMMDDAKLVPAHLISTLQKYARLQSILDSQEKV